MGFVNERKSVIKAKIKPEYPNAVSDMLVHKVREVLWKKPELIDEYINETELPQERIDILKLWRTKHKKGMLVILEYRPEYAVAIAPNEQGEDRLYGIKGISNSVSNTLRRGLPAQIETVLLPFKGKIIYDSLAMGFLNRVFRGCHDLLLLNDNKTVVDILDRVCKLEFKVIESQDSEDFEDDSPFKLEDAAEEGMLSMSISDIETDWVTAYVKLADRWDSPELAKRLVEVFNQPICKKLNPSMFIGKEIPNDLFHHMFEILDVPHQKGSVLAASWGQIGELLDALKYQPYIDDQWEVEEIWKICNALLMTNKLEQEDWVLRKNIFSDIILHNYYSKYGCYDPMFDLSNKLCVKADEFLAFADIMDNSGYYKKEAAHLYHKYGRDDKYVSYLETHLEKESEIYVALINYYKEHDNFDRACRVAEQALEKCKDDLTEAFIYLLVDAEKREDKDKYKKLYSSAKRRRLADINRIDQALSDFNSGSYT